MAETASGPQDDEKCWQMLKGTENVTVSLSHLVIVAFWLM